MSWCSSSTNSGPRLGPRLETQKHDIADILTESMEHERVGLALYQELLGHVEGRSVVVEEFARTTTHCASRR